MTKFPKPKILTEVQKAAEWVRFARSNHALYGDTSSLSELLDALAAFDKAQAEAVK